MGASAYPSLAQDASLPLCLRRLGVLMDPRGGFKH